MTLASCIRGFTLVEILVAMLLGSVLLTISTQVLIQAAKTNRIAQQRGLIQEGSAIAKFFLERDIRRAGYYAGLNKNDEIQGTANVKVFAKACIGGDEDFTLMLFPSIFALNNTRGQYQCIENYIAQSDVLTLRYLSPIKKINTDANKRHKLYMRVGSNGGKVFKAKDRNHYQNELPRRPGDLFELKTYIYYLRETERKCADATISALYREYSNNKGFMEAEEILAGVEQMQFRFLVAGQLKSADEVSDGEWGQVKAVSVSLLFRADCSESFPSSQQSFLLQDFDFIPGTKKAFLREAYHFDIGLRN